MRQSHQVPGRGRAALDLNADLGEGPWESTSDAGLLAIVSSANVACGSHAGDPETMRRVCEEAARRGVVVGAHVSYADRDGFGRRRMTLPAPELEALVLDQLRLLEGIAAAAGSPVAYCKPHGALYNTIAEEEQPAQAVAAACAAFRPGLPVLGLPASAWLAVAAAHGLRPVGEAFADRAYAASGALVPRGEAGAVLHDADVIADRVATMVHTGRVEAVTGEPVPLNVESVCVHGDTPGALAIAGAVRSRLRAEGVEIASFVTRV